MKRKITITAFVLAGLFLTLFGYANLRFVNPSTSLQPIHARTFVVAGLTESNKSDYEAFLKSHVPVRAVALHPENQTLGLTYYHEVIGEDELLHLLSWEGKINAQSKEMVSSAPQCPVQGLSVLWEKITTSLRVVK